MQNADEERRHRAGLRLGEQLPCRRSYSRACRTPASARSAVLGGAFTSLMFIIGNVVVGLYLGRATVAQTYGAAGSAVVVLLWLYFSAQTFLFGAELTQAYDRRYGPRLESA